MTVSGLHRPKQRGCQDPWDLGLELSPWPCHCKSIEVRPEQIQILKKWKHLLMTGAIMLHLKGKGRAYWNKRNLWSFFGTYWNLCCGYKIFTFSRNQFKCISISGPEKAPHSSTLAWKIPWMEEPGRLQSMGLWRVGHDWTTSLSLFTFKHWRRKWQPTPVFLPGETQGQGSLVGCHLWGRTESDTTEVT